MSSELYPYIVTVNVTLAEGWQCFRVYATGPLDAKTRYLRGESDIVPDLCEVEVVGLDNELENLEAEKE